MRTTLTFVLYLLVDTDEPKGLRGTLRPIVNAADYPFSDEQGLLNLLYQMTSRADMPTLLDAEQEAVGHE